MSLVTVSSSSGVSMGGTSPRPLTSSTFLAVIRAYCSSLHRMSCESCLWANRNSCRWSSTKPITVSG